MDKRKTSLATRYFRLMKKIYDLKIPFLPKVMFHFMRIIFSCEIPFQSNIGEGTDFIHNGLGVVIHPEAKIGKYNKIMQNVTIGGRNGRGAPHIGDYCFIGVGACILGDITIGNNVMIGANAVVINDIPDNMVVVGIPGTIKKTTNESLIGKFKD
ncbi:serine O-acetyltransferase [Heyndrickxia coagulans]|uniref:serine O-acetyltransferase n=1 Tax=Heyndrickxia coagulans TaxID=1398 RepID=UPI0007790731|nr:serine acetyltransferase [Heyndrickxia coagulans]